VLDLIQKNLNYTVLYIFAATFVYSGGWIGNVICLLSSGFIAASPIGWPSCFYTWGSITILCGISFYLLGKDSPSEHSDIPLDEKEYIEISLGVTEISESEVCVSSI
jgi:sugar phosphate permease